MVTGCLPADEKMPKPVASGQKYALDFTQREFKDSERYISFMILNAVVVLVKLLLVVVVPSGGFCVDKRLR